MCAAGVLVILGIFAFVDYVWNGTFVDWFTRNYMRETGSVYAGKDVIIREPSWPDETGSVYAGKDVIIREPSWPELKKLIFTVLAVSIVFWIAVVFAVSHFYAKSREKKTVTAISQEIQSYMQANEIRPQGCTSRTAVLQALKFAVLHHTAKRLFGGIFLGKTSRAPVDICPAMCII